MKKNEQAFDALKRIDELEKENKFLKAKVKRLKFQTLPEQEKEWVENVFKMLYPDEDTGFLNEKWRKFKEDYITHKGIDYLVFC